METEVNPEQPLKAYLPILVTLFEIAMEDKLSQYENACSPISVTPLGMEIDFKFEHPEKAYKIVVTLLGIMVLLHAASIVFVAVSIIALQPSLLSYFSFPSITSIVVKAGHRPNS